VQSQRARIRVKNSGVHGDQQPLSIRKQVILERPKVQERIARRVAPMQLEFRALQVHIDHQEAGVLKANLADGNRSLCRDGNRSLCRDGNRSLCRDGNRFLCRGLAQCEQQQDDGQQVFEHPARNSHTSRVLSKPPERKLRDWVQWTCCESWLRDRPEKILKSPERWVHSQRIRGGQTTISSAIRGEVALEPDHVAVGALSDLKLDCHSPQGDLRQSISTRFSALRSNGSHSCRPSGCREWC
jgi:hypothetical protein